MLRAALIVVILAGLAVLGLSLTTVSDKIKTLTTERDASQAAEQTAKQSEQKARAAEKKSRDDADKLKSELASATNNLQVVQARATEQERRANRLAEELDKSNTDRVEAQQKLARWEALSTTVEDVKQLKGALAEATRQRDAFTEENRILLRRMNVLQARLDVYEGPEKEVKLPQVKARVVAVDPKYDFVVVDAGSNQGLLERGKLIVTRDGKLLAKLRVTSVEPNRSVANVMSDWKQGEVMEGDMVLTSYEALAQP